MKNSFLHYLVIVSIVMATLYAIVQQTYRTAANDPQLQMAYDLKNRIEEGKSIGMIASALVLLFAFVAGHFRGIPIGWRLVDCSFGIVAFIVLWICHKQLLLGDKNLLVHELNFFLPCLNCRCCIGDDALQTFQRFYWSTKRQL